MLPKQRELLRELLCFLQEVILLLRLLRHLLLL